MWKIIWTYMRRIKLVLTSNPPPVILNLVPTNLVDTVLYRHWWSPPRGKKCVHARGKKTNTLYLECTKFRTFIKPASLNSTMQVSAGSRGRSRGIPREILGRTGLYFSMWIVGFYVKSLSSSGGGTQKHYRLSTAVLLIVLRSTINSIGIRTARALYEYR